MMDKITLSPNDLVSAPNIKRLDVDTLGTVNDGFRSGFSVVERQLVDRVLVGVEQSGIWERLDSGSFSC